MTTHHAFRCPACGEETRWRILFNALRAVAEQNVPACRCGASTALHLTFDFALDVPDKNAEVLASFLPHQLGYWQDSRGRTVTFYRFPTGTLFETVKKSVVSMDNGRRSWT
jgi:hypothetical protein